MPSPAAAIPFTDDSDPTPATAWAYRRRARRLRHRLQKDPAALLASLKSLAAEVDAATPPRPILRPTVSARRVEARVLEPAASSVPQPTPKEPATSAPPPEDYLRRILNAPPAAVDRFAALVRAMLGEGVIRYSRRQALLRQADRLGVGRFEASLIIAAVEHRHRTYARPADPLPPVRRRSISALLATVLVVEAAALAVLWAFL